MLTPGHSKGVSITTVADLFRIVKQEEPEFLPKNVAPELLNPDGTPKVMYHGTSENFWQFDHRKATDIRGRRMGLGAGKGKFYLTEHRMAAENAASGAQYAGYGNSPHVMELYVSAHQIMDRAEYELRLEAEYQKHPEARPHSENYDYPIRDKAIAAIDKQIRKEGYDGVLDRESGEMFVFDPRLIKSSTDNVGGFDGANPDIRYADPEPLLPSPEILDSEMAEFHERMANPPTEPPVNGTQHRNPINPGVRQFAGQTAQRSNAIPDWLKQTLWGDRWYERDSNRAQAERAYEHVASEGWEAARQRLLNEEAWNADDNVEALILLHMALRPVNQGGWGNPAAAMEIAHRFNTEGTKQGQALQARQLFQSMTDAEKAKAISGVMSAAKTGAAYEMGEKLGHAEKAASSTSSGSTKKALAAVPGQLQGRYPELDKMFEATGDGLFLPKGIDSSFTRGVQYNLSGEDYQNLWQLYIDELDARMAKIDWGLPPEEVAAAVSSAYSGADKAAKDKYVKHYVKK